MWWVIISYIHLSILFYTKYISHLFLSILSFLIPHHIFFYIFPIIINICMSSLRTAFVQTSSKAPFSSLLDTLLPVPQSSTNPEQSLTCLQMRKKLKRTNSRQAFFQPLSLLNQSNLKTITKYINLNINNFSQLIDGNANDFKGCDNFVHVLQFEQNNSEQVLEEIQTVMSINRSLGYSTGDGIEKMSTQSEKGQELFSQQYSEVQDIEMETP